MIKQNPYNTDVIYKNFKTVVRTVLFVNEFTWFSYYNIGLILKLVHKKNCQKTSTCTDGLYLVLEATFIIALLGVLLYK